MAKIKYNVKGVDRGGNFEQPQPGLYEMEIKEANHRANDGKNDVELVLEVTKANDKYSGSRVWTYVNLGESSQWKLAEFTDALGLPETGTLDTDKLKGKKLKVKINSDSYNNEYRARVGRFAPLSANGEVEEVEAEKDDPDADAENTGGDDEHHVLELNDVELSTDPDYYTDWSDQDVFDEIENQDLKLTGKKAKSRDAVIAALIEKVREEHDGPGAGEAEEDEENAGDEYDDADTWDDKALAAEYKKRGLTSITGKKNRANVIAALREDDAAANDDDPFAED